MFVVLYASLLVLFLYLLNAKIQHGPDPLEDVEEAPLSSLPDSLRDVFRRHVPLATTAAGPVADQTSQEKGP